MAYNAIAAVANVLSVLRPDFQELELINQMNSFFNFDHNVFLLDSVAGNSFLNTKSNFTAPQSIHYFDSVDDNLIGLENLKEIKSKNTFVIVVLASSKFENNVNIRSRIKEIQRLNMKIGVFFMQSASSEDLEKLFKWCWKNKIINLFVTTRSYREVAQGSFSDYFLNIATFNPFGTFRVINVTGSETFDHLFLSQNSNFQQDTFRLGQLQNYTYKSDELLWEALLCVLNASLEVVNMNETHSLLEMFEYGNVDVIRTTYFYEQESKINLYPMTIEAEVIIVPASLPYSEVSAYLRTVTSDYFFGYSIFAIVAVVFILTFIRYIKEKKIEFFESAADVLNLLISDNGAIKYQQLPRIEVFIIVPLTFSGLAIANGVLSVLQSYITRPIFQPQIDDIEDIYRSQFPILTRYALLIDSTVEVLEDLLNHGDWKEKFRAEDYELLKEQIAMYNTSISFLTTWSFAKFVLDLQKQFNIRGYHNPKLHIGKYLLSYPTIDHFPFLQRFNEILHWMRCAGLHDKWLREDLDDLRRNVFKNREHLKNSDKTDIETFQVPMFIVYGWVASVIVFAIEIVWKHFHLSTIKTKIFKDMKNTFKAFKAFRYATKFGNIDFKQRDFHP